MTTNAVNAEPGKELPKLYHLIVTKDELTYLGLGLTGSAAAISQDLIELVEFQTYSDKWVAKWLEQNPMGDPVLQVSNPLAAKIAKLLGFEKCPNCHNYHPQGQKHE